MLEGIPRETTKGKGRGSKMGLVTGAVARGVAESQESCTVEKA